MVCGMTPKEATEVKTKSIGMACGVGNADDLSELFEDLQDFVRECLAGEVMVHVDPVNAITRDDISAWVARMKAAGKRPSTIRNVYFLVRQVLAQAVADGRVCEPLSWRGCGWAT